jgi:hypothetical protein
MNAALTEGGGLAMLGEAGRVQDRDAWRAERAIVLQLLRDDREERWSRVELVHELRDCEPAMLQRALTRLECDGVLHVDRSCAWASRAARRLDELELVGL